MELTHKEQIELGQAHNLAEARLLATKGAGFEIEHILEEIFDPKRGTLATIKARNEHMMKFKESKVETKEMSEEDIRIRDALYS